MVINKSFRGCYGKMSKQLIQFTSGCPNNCEYCYEPKEIKQFTPDIKNLDKDVQILDMNFLANPNHIKILKSLPKRNYELICGFDFRLLTSEVVELFKKKGFIKLRWAWDYSLGSQRKHQKIWRMLTKAGFRSEDLSIFILVNWKIPYSYCCDKLDLIKVWGVKVNDCCYDGGYKIAKPIYWTPEQIKQFRKKCRDHNQMIRFKLLMSYEGK